MQRNYAGFAQSVVVIVDLFAHQALAGFRHAGLVAAWSDREGPHGVPGRRVNLDRLQPIIDKLDGAADLEERTRNVRAAPVALRVLSPLSPRNHALIAFKDAKGVIDCRAAGRAIFAN